VLVNTKRARHGHRDVTSPARQVRRCVRIPCWNSGYITSATSSKLAKGDPSNRHIASNMTFPVSGER